MVTSKLEILVDFGVKTDQQVLDKTLKEIRTQHGVKDATFKDGAVIVETTLPSVAVLEMIAKSSGRRAVLQGFGETQSAVAMVSSQSCCSGQVMGVIRFQQTEQGPLVADGSVDGLTSGNHGLHVRDTGDLSQGCRSIGDHYNPLGTSHGGPGDPAECRHAGDLGNIVADETGRARFRILDDVLKISEIIGRSVAITERRDDLGRGSSPNSKRDGDSGNPIACGIIARSAGVFQNPKRICACDGVVVWDEKDRPLAGAGRRAGGDRCCQRDGAAADKSCCQPERGVAAKPCCKV